MSLAAFLSAMRCRMASDFLFLAKTLTEDAAYARDTDRHAWAAHYLTSMSKALVDDAVKVLTRDRDLCAGIQAGGGRRLKA